jgi:NTE family protein
MMTTLESFPARFLCGLLIVMLIAPVIGCAAFDYTGSDAPIAQTKPSPRPGGAKIAIVLGSGGPRGYAHIGIIKVLEEAGIEPDLIVGTSVGALIGAFWANGLNAKDIETQAFSGGPFTLFDINPFADRGWIRGQRLQDYIESRIEKRNIEQLKRPLIVVATRRNDKVPAFFTQGNIAVAVRASSAVPNVISPVGINGIEYEDGDVALPVAVRAARAAGADFIIAVDVSAHAGSAPPDTDKKWLERDAKRRSLIDPEVALADFLVHPDMGYMASPFRSFFDKAYKVGEETMRVQISALKAKLESRQAQRKTP